MQQPHDLVRMANDIGRKLRRDHGVDRTAVGLFEIEQPPEERLREHALAGVPLERHGDELGLVSVLAERLDETVREDLGASALERHLRHADGKPHIEA